VLHFYLSTTFHFASKGGSCDCSDFLKSCFFLFFSASSSQPFVLFVILFMRYCSPGCERCLSRGISRYTTGCSAAGALDCFNPWQGVNDQTSHIQDLWDYQWCTEQFMPSQRDGVTDMFWNAPWNESAAFETCKQVGCCTEYPCYPNENHTANVSSSLQSECVVCCSAHQCERHWVFFSQSRKGTRIGKSPHCRRAAGLIFLSEHCFLEGKPLRRTSTRA
jgi:hypothetical protein